MVMPKRKNNIYDEQKASNNKYANIHPFIKLSPAKPTVVYDTYWRFADARQRIFFKRFNGEAQPWTSDPILSKYKFTNAYRASDRVSQFLIKTIIYGAEEQRHEEVFFRIILFKLFNKIETWELLVKEVGIPTFKDFSFKVYDRILSNAMSQGKTIFSAAYIMPSGSKILGKNRKHQNCLKVLQAMMTDSVPTKIQEFKRMQDAFELLRSYPMIGDFLAYQFITDINYSQITNFSEMDFIIPGPGAKSGLRKCFSDFGGLNEEELIRYMADKQEEEFGRLGLQFQTLWGRRLRLIDCQNLFCEVDKYSRIAHPEIGPEKNKRTRIKQLFKANTGTINYWFPPKWGINSKIKHDKMKSVEG